MRLFWSTRSPFVRKVLVVAHEVGVADRIELRRTVVGATAPDAEVIAMNPLGKIPTLVTDDGEGLYDSRVIAEYLAGFAPRLELFPTTPAARWTALRQQALGDGFMEVLVHWRAERGRPDGARSERHVQALARKFGQALDGIDAEAAALASGALSIGQISIACALDYADFRYPEQDWRTGRPVLAKWMAGFGQRAAMRATEHSDLY